MKMAEEKVEMLSNNRIIYMTGNFTEQKAEQIVHRLFQYECDDPGKDILLFIDSYGGYVDSFVTIHETIKLLRCDVATCCIGKAMSCGQLLLISGKNGKRFITPNSRVMIHEFSAGSSGKLTELEIFIQENKRLQKAIFEKFNIRYTKLKKADLNRLKGKDTYLSAKECIKYGLVDHIITKPNVLYKNVDI